MIEVLSFHIEDEAWPENKVGTEADSVKMQERISRQVQNQNRTNRPRKTEKKLNNTNLDQCVVIVVDSASTKDHSEENETSEKRKR